MVLHSSLRQLLKAELLSDVQLADNGAVTLNICLLEVVEKISSVTYHLEKSAAAVVILVVSLEVFVEIVDPVSEKRDLNLRRAGISLMSSILLDNCLLFVLKHDFFHLSLIYLSGTQLPVGELPFIRPYIR